MGCRSGHRTAPGWAQPTHPHRRSVGSAGALPRARGTAGRLVQLCLCIRRAAGQAPGRAIAGQGGAGGLHGAGAAGFARYACGGRLSGRGGTRQPHRPLSGWAGPSSAGLRSGL